MKQLYFLSTLIFWIAVAAFWGANAWAPPQQIEIQEAKETRYSLNDVATHGNADDCWMVIDGQVYDLTEYLPKHPTRPEVIVPWCGKGATLAYNTKNRGRPHSSYASRKLQTYCIGILDRGAAP